MKENKKDDNYGSSLIRSIAEGGLDFAKDIAEIPIDHILDYDVIKDLPLVSMVIGIGKTILNVRDYFFIKKVAKFLQAFGSFSQQEKEGFAQKIKENPKHAQRTGEKLIIYLDRFDDIDKAMILAKLFSGYLRSDLIYKDFLKLSRAVDQAYIGDLHQLLKFYEFGDHEPHGITWAPWQDLFSSGLAKAILRVDVGQKHGLIVAKNRWGSQSLVGYQENDTARLLAQVVLGEKYRDFSLFNIHNL